MKDIQTHSLLVIIISMALNLHILCCASARVGSNCDLLMEVKKKKWKKGKINKLLIISRTKN